MLHYMLDTNVCIPIIKGQLPKLEQRYVRFASQLAISSITLAKLYYGAEKSRRSAENLGATTAFVTRLEVLPFSPKAAAHYGQIRAELEKLGKIIGANDLLIGAHARSEGLVLVTNNQREFDRIPGLRVENWL